MRHSIQLKKVAHKYSINRTEIIVVLGLGFLQIRVQIDQNFTVHHADFVDDQIWTILPMFRLATHLFLFLFANWKISGAMKSNSRDIESRGASGGGNDQLILSPNGSNQTTFSRAAFSKHSQLPAATASQLCSFQEYDPQ
jgi:hypothetical protein